MNTRAVDLKLGSKDHYELMRLFEIQFRSDGCGTYISARLDREPRELWKSSHLYQDGRVNQLFLAFRSGVALGLAIGRNEI